MKKLSLLIFVGVLASALVGSSAVWAGGTFTPVSGVMHYVVVDEGRQWLDEDGILHIRDAVMEWDFPEGEGDFVGTGWGIFKANIDLVTGDGDVQAHHYFDFSFGEVSGTCEGRSDDIVSGWVIVGQFIGHGDGGFAGMHLRNASTALWGSGLSAYEGILHDPKGGGGDKAIPANPQTWGSVKAIYR